MQQDSILINNSVSLIGKIATGLTFSHEVYGEGFYNFHIEVERLSQAADLLPVTISERLKDSDMLPIGSSVHITGQIRSYNNFIESDKKNKLILTVFTREIEILQDVDNSNPNEVFLNGFICKPPIYRTTPFGREISDLLLAVNRSYNKSDYIPCIAWGRNARFAGKLNVGDNVMLLGRMQSRTYQKKYENGETAEKVAFEVSISKLELPENAEENSDEM